MHTPALIRAHLELVDALAAPVLNWCDHGHQWAAPFGLALACLLLMWPLFALMLPLAVWTAWSDLELERAERRRRWRKLKVRRA